MTPLKLRAAERRQSDAKRQTSFRMWPILAFLVAR
jgi:hypothetical protein